MSTTNPIFVISSISHSPGRRPNRIAPPRVYHRGLVVLTAISDGNEQRTQYCDHQHRTPQAADACALVTARKLGLNRAQVCRACGTVRPGTRHATSTDAEQHIRTLAKLADTTGALAARDWLLNLAALSNLHHETRAGRDEGADDA